MTKLKRYSPLVWWGIALGFLFGRTFTWPETVGVEWYLFNQATQSDAWVGVTGVANPPFLALIIYPLSLLPDTLASLGLATVNVIGVWFAIKILGGNRWVVLASFPFGWLIFYSQIDGLVALGVALGWWAIWGETAEQKPDHWRGATLGAALVLLSLKPQVGFIVGLWFLINIPKSKRYLATTASVLSFVFLLSVLRYGFWPLNWLEWGVSQSTFFTEQTSNISLGNGTDWLIWGAVATAVVATWAKRGSKERTLAVLVLGMLAMPYITHYSLLSAIVFPVAWPIALALWWRESAQVLAVLLLFIPVTLPNLAGNRKPQTEVRRASA